MRIDILKTVQDRAGRYYVHFDNGTSMRLYRQTLEDFRLYAGMELTEEQFVALQKSADEMSARMRAVRIISATSISRKDLENRLVQKGERPAEAKQAVTWLEDLSLIDDQKTAEQIVHSCIAKGYGKSRAKQVLYEKRIPKEFWGEALQEYPDQKDRILLFLRQRLSGNTDDRTVKKAIDALLRRGHSYAVIREALKELSLDSEEFSEDESWH